MVLMLNDCPEHIKHTYVKKNVWRKKRMTTIVDVNKYLTQMKLPILFQPYFNSRLKKESMNHKGVRHWKFLLI